MVRYLWLAVLSCVMFRVVARAETSPDAAAPSAAPAAIAEPVDGPASAQGTAAAPAPAGRSSEGAAPEPASEPAAAAAPEAASDQAAAAAPVTASEKSDLKVRTLEERVSDLKEKIFRTKARLMNLQEMVIGGDIPSGSKAVVVHRNEMGSSFYLESVAYALDGAPIYAKTDQDGDLEKREEFEVFNGRVVPGNHQISVQLVYRGHGYGVFSYLEGYRFRVQSSHTFSAEPGKANTIKVVGYEKGGITAELKDRPAIRYDADVQREVVHGAGGPGGAPPPAEGAAR